jgi:flagellar biosynthetic protein FliO
VLVLLLAWVALRLLSRTVHGRGGGGAGDVLRVERVLALGARERLVLVRHGERQLLLGVTAGSIRLLQSRPGLQGEPEAGPGGAAAPLPPP